MDFKVGDVVRRISGENFRIEGMKRGNTYIVVKQEFQNLFLEGISDCWSVRCFELVKKKTKNKADVNGYI